MNKVLELSAPDTAADAAGAKNFSSAPGNDANNEPAVSYSLILLQVVLMLSALFVFIVWLFSYMINQRDNQELYINQQLSKAELRDVNLALIASADLAEIQTKLQSLDWVEGVSLTKKAGSDRSLVLINLAKAKRLARLANGEYVFSSKSGGQDLVAGDALPLFRFIEYEGDEEPELSPALDSALSQLHSITTAYDVAIAEFRLSGAGILEVLLSEGAVIKLGARDHQERLARLDRFLAGYHSRLDEAVSIDLRHRNAMAVLWSG